MSFGQRLRTRRKSLKITQQHLATALGVTPQHISAIEQDKRTPSLETLARIGEELGVTTDYLITGRESVVSNAVSVIKADRYLGTDIKKALTTIIKSLQK